MGNSSNKQHEDFGAILEQWDNAGTARPLTSSDSPAPTGGRSGRVDMESWLDEYPPEDKDATVSDRSAGSRRKNPEKMKVEDSLDLHGYRLEEALAATTLFIDQSVDQGFRKVVVVHGKGDNGQGILRREVRAHLERHPMTGAMGYNRGAEGGRGALWVILRERSRPESAPDL